MPDCPLGWATVYKYSKGPARGMGALRQNILKLQLLKKNSFKSCLTPNKMKLPGKNETIINIVEFS